MSRRRQSFVLTRVALAIVALLLASLVGMIRPADAAVFGPTLNSVTPNTVVPGVNNQKLKLNGDFTSGPATVTFSPASGITIVGSPTTVNASEIDVTVDVAIDAPYTARDVTVTQTVVTASSSTCAKCVAVVPDITSVGGPLSNKGTSGVLTITGHGLKSGSTVKIERKSYGFNGTENDSINATAVSITPGTAQNGNVATGTATVNPLDRAPGRWKVSVIGPDGVTATFGDGTTTGLQITGSQPTLAKITPTRIDSNQTDAPFTVTGAGFAQGMTALVSGSGITQSAKTVISSSKSATIRLSSTTPAAGPRTLVLQNADDQSSTNTEAICANCDFQTRPTPTITSVSPTIVGQGATGLRMIISGTNFGSLPAVTVAPNYADPTQKIDVQATRDSDTQLTLRVSTGPATPVHAEDMTVAFDGGATATKTNAFSVASDFTVQSITPMGRAQGYDGTFEINGSGFAGGPTVAMNPAADITITTVTVDSPSRLTVGIKVGTGADTSVARDVAVTQAGTTQTCTGCFKVGTTPTVTGISPNSGNGGGAVAISNIAGTNFAPDPIVTLERPGQNKITMAPVTRESATKISGTFDLTDAAPGVWNLTVTNADGGASTLPNAFTVVLPAPTVTASNPDTVSQNIPAVKLALTGTSFAPGMVVTIPNAEGVTVTDVTRTSTTTADVTIKTSDTATLGSRDVKVTNTDAQAGTCTSCFTVTQGTQPTSFGPGITAYENFNGGAFVAAGNIDAVPTNGVEFVTAPNAGGGPHIRPYRINSANGAIQELGGGFMAYSPQFTGGVRVAVGNIDGNAANGDEIVTAPGPGGGPHVRVFHLNNDLTVSEPFGTGYMAYAPSFAGGVWVGAGDVNGDGKDDIITGAGAGGGPHVRVWTLAADGHTFNEIGGWMAYGTTYTGGAYVASGNFIPEASNAPQLDEVVTVPAFGGGPHTRITDGAGRVLSEFMAFGTSDDNGYRVTGGDFDFDTVSDIAVSKGSSGEIFIAQITSHGPVALVQPNPAPYGNLPIGTNLAAADVDGDGDADLVLSPDHNSAVTIRLIRPLSR